MNYSISTNDSLYSKSNNSQIISYSLSQFQNGGIKNINQNQNNINKNNNQNISNKKINNKNVIKNIHILQFLLLIQFLKIEII